MKQDRVLSRMGARELTYKETEVVSGAFNTQLCSVALTNFAGTVTRAGDNDGCGDSDQS